MDVQRLVRSIWDNCKRFNAPRSQLGAVADTLGMRTARLFKAWLGGGDGVQNPVADVVACSHCERPSGQFVVGRGNIRPGVDSPIPT